MNNSKLPKFSSRVFLAPMAGITDPAFRMLCKDFGCGLAVTELTSVHAIVAKHKELKEKNTDISEFIEYSNLERPVSVQLFGNDIELIANAAKIVEEHFDIIDFNMGCPAPHITNQMAGAALLQTPDHVEKLLSKLVDSVNKPVTLKLRAGVKNSNCYLYKNIAKIAENSGISMIALHARTIEQGYSGKSNWELIKELKELVNIPVVGNGDITCPEDAKKMFEETGCDYVMVGRAAMGNPLIFKQITDYLKNDSYEKYDQLNKLELFYKYLDYAKDFKINFSNIKMQANYFTKGIDNSAKVRLRISTAKDISEIKTILDEEFKIGI